MIFLSFLHLCPSWRSLFFTLHFSLTPFVAEANSSLFTLNSSLKMQRVTHPVLFRLEIAQVVGVGCYLDGHILDNLQPLSLESHALHWVVSQQAHLVDTQMPQHLCPTAIVSLIGLEA